MQPILTSALAGVAAGSAYAVLAVGLTLTYRLVSVVNFTGAATGAVGAFAMMWLCHGGVGLAAAAAVGILVGAAFSVAIGWVLTRWFMEKNDSIKAAVTVALLVGVVSCGVRVSGGHHPQDFPALVSGSAFRLASVEITNATVLAMALAICFALGAHLVMRHTRFGLQLSALSERPVAAQLLGLRVREMSLMAWAVAGVLSTVAIIIIAPQRAADFATLSALAAPAMAAALVGSFRNLWLTIMGGLGLGVLEGVVSAVEGFGQFRGMIPLLVILVILIWSQRGARWDEAR
jgi:branched-chain amino acid transport system permease protein